MRGINSLFLLGTLRGDPDQLTSKSGKNYVRFEIELVTVRRKDGMDEEQREIVPITAFGKLGEIVVNCLNPGDPVHVVAHISSNEFKTEAGATKRSISVVADSVQLIPTGRKPDASGQSQQRVEQSSQWTKPVKLGEVPVNEHGEPTTLPF
jgi:single-stranded DNA-binding protein